MLDRSRPYCEVHGNGRRLLVQDGRCYNLDGHEVPDPDAPPDAPPGFVPGPPAPFAPADASHAGSEVSPVSPQRELVRGEAASAAGGSTEFPAVAQMAERARAFPADDMRLRENRMLKAQMEAFGQGWLGADHARQYLAGRGETSDE